MNAFTKLAVSLHLCKYANEQHEYIQKGIPAKVKAWDTIKGIAGGSANTDKVDPENPNPMNIATDIYSKNKQLISGTGTGPAM